MTASHASVQTANGSSYLTKLCKHWSHRFPVTYDQSAGTIDLPGCRCTLAARPESLEIKLEIADGEDCERIEKVVEEHLQRFGFKEDLAFVWQRSSVVAAG